MSGDVTEMADLIEFRSDLYGCLTGWRDALFELCDAVLCSPSPVGSVPSLSLEPVFRRGHGSLYKALARGRLGSDRLRRSLVANRPASWPLVFAVDASTWDRCDAETSPERGFYYSASKHSAGQPIVAGWNYQWISQLSFTPDSWTAPCDVLRIPPTVDTTNATIDQIRRLVALLPTDSDVPMFVFDAGYDPIAIGHELAATRTQVLCRIRDDRVFHSEPPPRPNRPAGTGGRPPRHGPRFKCSDPSTWPEPTDRLATTDPRHGTITITAWNGLHPRLWRRGHWSDHDNPPIVTGTVWASPRPADREIPMLSDDLYETYRTMFEGHGQARDLLAQLDQLGLAVLEADPRYGQHRGRGPTTPADTVDTPRSKHR